MPKKVFTNFIRGLEKDIKRNCKPGDRYLTVREIAERFGISLQTAQKGVATLCGCGMLVAKPKSGIHVKTTEAVTGLKGKKVILFSDNLDPRFNKAFLAGASKVLGPQGISVNLVLNTIEDTRSLDFGKHMVDLAETAEAHAIIALGFRDQALPFYHVQRQGIDLISDIAQDLLPTLASVQTNNARHASEAAKQFHRFGKNNIVATGYWDRENTRYIHFKQAILRLNPNAKVHYVHLANARSVAQLHLFFNEFHSNDGVFSIEYTANHVVAPYFVKHHVPVKDSFLVYDAEQGLFQYPGLEQVTSVGPSLMELGERLAQKLAVKLETGKWPEPLIELM